MSVFKGFSSTGKSTGLWIQGLGVQVPSLTPFLWKSSNSKTFQAFPLLCFFKQSPPKMYESSVLEKGD